MPQTPTTGLVDASWDDVIGVIAKKHGVNPALARAVAKKESSVTPGVIGDGGKAVGMFQLHEAAAADMGLTPEDRADPLKNIDGGVRYLKHLSDRYEGDLNKTLMAYNGGMGNVDKGTISPEAQAYAATVLADLSAGMRQTTRSGAAGGRRSGAGPGGTGLPGSRATAAGSGGGGAGAVVPTGDPVYNAAVNVAKSVDPRTPEGRKNAAGIAGSLAVSMATRGLPAGPIITRIAQTLGPAVGAAVTSGAEVAAENAIGTSQESPIAEGAKQAAYDIGGQLVSWPFRALGRRLIAPRVATKAADALKTQGVTIREQGQAAIRAARDAGHTAVETVRAQVDDALGLVRRTFQATMDAAKGDAAATVGKATTNAADLLAAAEVANGAELAAANKLMDDLTAQAPSIAGGARAVKETLTGPTKRALEIAGARVGATAEKLSNAGVVVNVKGVKEALAEMAKRARPAAIFSSNDPAPSAIGFLSHVGEGSRALMTAESLEQLNAEIAQSMGASTAQLHPKLPGTIGKLLTMEGDTLTFAEAHQVKQLLDEAVNWDRAAKKVVERATKATRIALREAMAGHTEYDSATAVYSSVVQLHRKGVGKQLLTMAQTPGGLGNLSKLLKGNDPQKAEVVRQLLYGQATAGGDARLGQEAWDAVRSQYTYDQLTSKGIDKLAGNLDTLLTQHPEFVRAVYGDMSGRQVLMNLGKISDAYAVAMAGAEARTAAAKTIGKAGVDEAKDLAGRAIGDVRREGVAAIDAAKAAGGAKVRAAKQSARQRVEGKIADLSTKQEQHANLLTEFKESSVGPFRGKGIADVGADALRFGSLGFGSVWGAQSGLRLFLQGPKGGDLIRWAALSPGKTQTLVNLLTKPGPPEAVALFLRGAQAAMFPGQAPSDTAVDAVRSKLAAAAPSTPTTPLAGAP